MTPTPANDFGVKKMTPQQQNEAIAKWMGWEPVDWDDDKTVYWWKRPGAYAPERCVPDFVNDLNVMVTAEDKLNGQARERYIDLCGFRWEALQVPASKRAEALLRTLGLWVEEPQ